MKTTRQSHWAKWARGGLRGMCGQVKSGAQLSSVILLLTKR